MNVADGYAFSQEEHGIITQVVLVRCIACLFWSVGCCHCYVC